MAQDIGTYLVLGDPSELPASAVQTVCRKELLLAFPFVPTKGLNALQEFQISISFFFFTPTLCMFYIKSTTFTIGKVTNVYIEVNGFMVRGVVGEAEANCRQQYTDQVSMTVTGKDKQTTGNNSVPVKFIPIVWMDTMSSL